MPENIEYEIYRRLDDTEKTKTYIIVINSDIGRMENLKLLGENLKKEYMSTTITNIFVYDDKLAADMFREDDENFMPNFYDNHFVASYCRNIYSKHHEFYIHLPKEEGGELKIAYSI